MDARDSNATAWRLLRATQESLATADARAEHWAAQADRLARQVEAMRTVMLEVAHDLERFQMPRECWHEDEIERLRRVAGGEEGEA